MTRFIAAIGSTGLMLYSLTFAARAQTLVNDSWADGTRTDPAAPTYSEFGTDSDSDGDIESAWIAANRATNFIAAVGSLTFYPASSSRAGLTYFTPAASPVTLADGQGLRVSLTFKPSGVAASSSATTTRFAIADYTGGTRLTSDGTSSSMNGAGVKAYGLFLNVANSFGLAPLSLRERSNLSSTDLLGTATDWTTLGSGGGQAGDPGFFDGVTYTMVLTLARIGSSLDFTAAISGGSLNISHTVTDTSPSTFTFDAFGLRAANSTDTPTMQFTNFKVELYVVPEPSSMSLLAVAGLGLIIGRRLVRRRV